VKVPINAREKVGHVWLVDPLLQTLEVLRLDGPGYRIAGVSRGDVVVQCEPFEALAIRLADLWSV
jgi:Uma2 family endonuclease